MISASMGAAKHARVFGANYPWKLVGLLWMVSFLNYADRSILVAVMPQLRQEFGLTATQLPLINSVFFWVYALGPPGPPCGGFEGLNLRLEPPM